MGNSEVTVTRHDNGNSGEYHAHVVGSQVIGRLTWVGHDGVRDAQHTLVPDAIGGRGVAGELVQALIADARSEGFKVIPSCSYVAAQFKRHPEWSDLLA